MVALIKCPECGREVSDKALSCHNCGYPITQDLLEWAMDFETTPSIQASEPKKEQPSKREHPLVENVPSSDKKDCDAAAKKKDRKAIAICSAILVALLTYGIWVGSLREKPRSSSSFGSNSTSSRASTSYASSSNSSSSKYSSSWKSSGSSSSSRSSSSSASSGSSKSSSSSDKIKAGVYTLAEKCVKNHLKSPSSAKFCSMADCEFQKGEDGVYMMAGTVESENSYGAMLQETWGIMAQVDGDRVSLVMVQIGDEVYFE